MTKSENKLANLMIAVFSVLITTLNSVGEKCNWKSRHRTVKVVPECWCNLLQLVNERNESWFVGKFCIDDLGSHRSWKMMKFMSDKQQYLSNVTCVDTWPAPLSKRFVYQISIFIIMQTFHNISSGEIAQTSQTTTQTSISWFSHTMPSEFIHLVTIALLTNWLLLRIKNLLQFRAVADSQFVTLSFTSLGCAREHFPTNAKLHS